LHIQDKNKKLYIDDKIKGKNDLMDAHHANMRITCFPFSFARWTPATTKPCLTTYRITKELSELIDSKPRSDRINKFGEKKNYASISRPKDERNYVDPYQILARPCMQVIIS